ncbi:MAG: fibronectin type III domain-containing protein [Micrococcales bacterium]|nr:fibronectin type III domain-containing protein [Micrococcales bacterium]
MTRSRIAGAVIATTAVALVSAALTATPAVATTPDLGQKVAVPAYIPPSDTTSWASLTSAHAQLDFIVVNVANGPDSAVNATWKTIIDTAHAAGTKVLGYIDSGYFGASVPARTTVLGDTDATSWLVQAQQDADRWYQFYGSSIDGIFVDDGLNTCGPTTGSNAYVDLYEQLDDYIHGNHPGSLTVVNPGITVPECYEDTADIIVSFEGSYADYVNPSPERATAQWQLDGDPNKFWHIVYDVPEAQIAAVTAASKSNNAGYLYLTPDVLANPYDTAPTGSYWTSELAATAATSTTVPSTPARPSATDVYSTGLDLSWTSSSSSNIVGYEVYRDGLHIGSVGNYYPASSEFTDVGLTPATSYSYTIAARHLNGKLSAQSTARSVTTDVVWGNAPGAPGSLAGSDLTANGIRLGWTASSVTNDPVAYYDVYANGVRRATVGASVTSVHLGFLDPGTAYSFTVRARSTSNAQSAAATTVSVTTPNPAPIENASVVFGATTTTFQAQYNLTFNFQNVFIDADGNAATGYPVGGIGADFLIQNGGFFQHATGAATWDWSPVTLGSGPLVSNVGGLVTWEVPSSTFGAATSLSVVFNGSGSSPDETLAPIVATR